MLVGDNADEQEIVVADNNSDVTPLAITTATLATEKSTDKQQQVPANNVDEFDQTFDDYIQSSSSELSGINIAQAANTNNNDNTDGTSRMSLLPVVAAAGARSRSPSVSPPGSRMDLRRSVTPSVLSYLPATPSVFASLKQEQQQVGPKQPGNEGSIPINNSGSRIHLLNLLSGSPSVYGGNAKVADDIESSGKW